MIYFIENVTSGIIKIGFTLRLTKRLKALRGTTGENLRVIAIMDGDRRIESLLHWKFSHLKVDLEWFRPGEDLQDYIRQNARDWDGADEKTTDEGGVTVRLGSELKEKARYIRSQNQLRHLTFVQMLSSLLERAIELELAEIKREIERVRRAKERGEHIATFLVWPDFYPFESESQNALPGSSNQQGED